jgi:glycosyltransferase involved in cell wall biosynthesis
LLNRGITIMHILFVVAYAPSLIRVRPYQLIRALAARGHAVTLATLVERDDELASLDQIRGWGVDVISERLSRSRSLLNCAAALVTPDPLQAHFCWQPRLAAALDGLVATRAFDVTHVEHLRSARYGLRLIARDKSPVVWDSVDSITHLFEQSARRSASLPKRLMTALDLPRTRRYEGALVRTFAQVCVTSPVDQRALRALGGPSARPVTVIPNGVDLDAFAPSESPRDPRGLVFSGKMSYHANISAVLHLANAIMPRVWARIPDATLTIVGKDPSPAVRALAGQFAGRVIVTGYVPDVAAHLQRAAAALVPVFYGAGLQNKVLEAMATATPVVASPAAVSALDPASLAGALIADDADAFADHVVRLLNDPAHARQIGRDGRAYVERNHTWQGAAQALEQVYQSAVFTT